MSNITLFGKTRCAKTRFYQRALEERELDYELVQVDKDPEAARRLTELVGSTEKFPTFQITGRKVRNPSLQELDRELARAGLYDPGLVHNEKSQRFIRHMAPSDAFVSYVWRGSCVVLTHIEIDPTLRGKGTGTQFADEVLAHLEAQPHQFHITCPFMQKVAAARA